jgi:hypothetical protein
LKKYNKNLRSDEFEVDLDIILRLFTVLKKKLEKYSLSFLVYCVFYSAKILDGDWSISGIPVSDWFIFAEKTQLTRKLRL